MRLRVRPRAGVAHRTPALMLSSSTRAWCRIDARSLRRSAADASSTVVLTAMQADQVGGLLDLRHGAPVQLYATPAAFEHLTQVRPVLPVLEQFCGVHWHLIAVAGEQREADFAIDDWPTLSSTALTIEPGAAGDRIALAVRELHSGARLFVGSGSSLDSAEGHGTGWLERFARLPGARKLLLDANGSGPALMAARVIQCAASAMDIEL